MLVANWRVPFSRYVQQNERFVLVLRAFASEGPTCFLDGTKRPRGTQPFNFSVRGISRAKPLSRLASHKEAPSVLLHILLEDVRNFQDKPCNLATT